MGDGVFAGVGVAADLVGADAFEATPLVVGPGRTEGTISGPNHRRGGARNRGLKGATVSQFYAETENFDRLVVCSTIGPSAILRIGLNSLTNALEPVHPRRRIGWTAILLQMDVPTELNRVMSGSSPDSVRLASVVPVG